MTYTNEQKKQMIDYAKEQELENKLDDLLGDHVNQKAKNEIFIVDSSAFDRKKIMRDIVNETNQ